MKYLKVLTISAAISLVTTGASYSKDAIFILSDCAFAQGAKKAFFTVKGALPEDPKEQVMVYKFSRKMKLSKEQQAATRKCALKKLGK